MADEALDPLGKVDARLAEKRRMMDNELSFEFDLLAIAEDRAREIRKTLESAGMPSWLTALHLAELRAMAERLGL